jgi:hypothetical protein
MRLLVRPYFGKSVVSVSVMTLSRGALLRFQIFLVVISAYGRKLVSVFQVMWFARRHAFCAVRGMIRSATNAANLLAAVRTALSSVKELACRGLLFLARCALPNPALLSIERLGVLRLQHPLFMVI